MTIIHLTIVVSNANEAEEQNAFILKEKLIELIHLRSVLVKDVTLTLETT